jgi:hypothetical protein
MLLPTSKLRAALNELIQQTSRVEYIAIWRLQFCKCGGQDLSEIAPLAEFTLQNRLEQQQQHLPVITAN